MNITLARDYVYKGEIYTRGTREVPDAVGAALAEKEAVNNANLRSVPSIIEPAPLPTNPSRLGASVKEQAALVQESQKQQAAKQAENERAAKAAEAKAKKDKAKAEGEKIATDAAAKAAEAKGSTPATITGSGGAQAAPAKAGPKVPQGTAATPK